jgi:hypothetical protein
VSIVEHHVSPERKSIDEKGNRRENEDMSSYVWLDEDGWPYPDTESEFSSQTSAFDVDDDVLCLQASSSHVFDTLNPLERQIIQARYGLGGQPVRSMKQLVADLGMARSDLRQALGSGLEKLRLQLR